MTRTLAIYNENIQSSTETSYDQYRNVPYLPDNLTIRKIHLYMNRKY